MDIKSAVKKVEDYYGRKLDWKSRKADVMEMRTILVHILLNDKYHPEAIANLLGINRTTVLYHRKKVKQKYYKDRLKDVLGANSVENNLTEFKDQAKYQLLKPLIQDLSIKETREIAKMIELHLKAKQWKYEDKIKKYDCSTDISNLVF